MDPNNIKWQHHLSPGIPIPTPWGQDEMDELRTQIDTARDQFKVNLTKLKALNTSDEEITTAQQQHDDEVKALRDQIKAIREKYIALYDGKIGVFEGAGYTPKGLYRSEIRVGMIRDGDYGPVSEEGILAVINHLSR